MDKFLITKQGYKKLKNLIDELKNIERPKIINQIAAARELGDLKENADYHAAKDKQGFIEAQIIDFEDKYSRAEVIDIAKLSGNRVLFGSTIILENSDNGKKVTYKIVSDFEADIDNNLISNASPVAKALIGREVGDEVEIRTPGGIVNYEILDIRFID
jgi:transcription elongation factor GreA